MISVKVDHGVGTDREGCRAIEPPAGRVERGARAVKRAVKAAGGGEREEFFRRVAGFVFDDEVELAGGAEEGGVDDAETGGVEEFRGAKVAKSLVVVKYIRWLYFSAEEPAVAGKFPGRWRLRRG